MVRAGARRQVVRLGPAIQAEAGRATRRLKEFLVGAGLGKSFHAFISLRLQPEAVTAPLLRDRARIDATLKMFGQNFRLPAAISLSWVRSSSGPLFEVSSPIAAASRASIDYS